MKLIREEIETVQVLTEEKDGTKSFYIQGPFLQGDIKNRNGRIYESRVLAKEVARYNENFIKRNRALGELGHPDGPTVNLDRVSHNITELYQEGSNFIGKAKILGTPMGEIVKNFIDEGIHFGVSTRGLGSVKPTKDGIMEVQDDFHLATVDIVTDPSGPQCFVNGIMENVEFYYDVASNTYLPAHQQEEVAEVVEEIQREVKRHYKRTIRQIDEGVAAAQFERFIKSLTSK